MHSHSSAPEKKLAATATAIATLIRRHAKELFCKLNTRSELRIIVKGEASAIAEFWLTRKKQLEEGSALYSRLTYMYVLTTQLYVHDGRAILETRCNAYCSSDDVRILRLFQLTRVPFMHDGRTSLESTRRPYHNKRRQMYFTRCNMLDAGCCPPGLNIKQGTIPAGNRSVYSTSNLATKWTSPTVGARAWRSKHHPV